MTKVDLYSYSNLKAIQVNRNFGGDYSEGFQEGYWDCQQKLLNNLDMFPDDINFTKEGLLLYLKNNI